MNTGWSLFLWSNLAGVLLLPAFSNAGYYPFDIEYLSVALLSVLLGAGFSQIARIPYVGLFLLLTLVGFTTITYFTSTTIVYSRAKTKTKTKAKLTNV